MDNLIVLCSIDHKRVDDQVGEFPASRLRQIKVEHERWVQYTLSQRVPNFDIRFKRIKGGAPEFLKRIHSGAQLVDLAQGAHAGELANDDPANSTEAGLLDAFFQIVDDLDVTAETASGRIRAALSLSRLLGELEDAGFLVIGASERQAIEAGNDPPSSWNVLHLRVVRSTSPEIFRVDLSSANSPAADSCHATKGN